MDCKTVKKYLDSYSKNMLEEELSGSIAKHLAKCKSCSEELSVLTMVNGLVNEDLKQYHENPFFANKVMSAITNEKGKKGLLFTPRIYALTSLLAAASVVLGIFLGQLVYSHDTGIFIQKNSETSLFADEYYYTQDANPYNFKVEDFENQTNNNK
ncbi:MAG TPA: hypothetical protein PLA24_04560 [Tenuifilaceae bacterium]|nr:hypothetical protein [Tenuifilaceae bacterium]HRX31827.1 hypothetical protein [Tenuifilaceae bacterium]